MNLKEAMSINEACEIVYRRWVDASTMSNSVGWTLLKRVWLRLRKRADEIATEMTALPDDNDVPF